MGITTFQARVDPYGWELIKVSWRRHWTKGIHVGVSGEEKLFKKLFALVRGKEIFTHVQYFPMLRAPGKVSRGYAQYYVRV